MGCVAETRPGGLLVELEAPRSLRRRGRVQVEWVDRLGLVRIDGRVTGISSHPRSLVEIEFSGEPELIQRREHMRAPADVTVSAWSLLEPTRRVTGTTVDLSGGGALLRLPGLPRAATLLDVRVALSDRPLAATARIIRQYDPDLVALAWETIGADERERLIEFVQEQLRTP